MTLLPKDSDAGDLWIIFWETIQFLRIQKWIRHSPLSENLLSGGRYRQKNWWLKYKYGLKIPSSGVRQTRVPTLPPPAVRLWAHSLACLRHSLLLCKVIVPTLYHHENEAMENAWHQRWTQEIAISYCEGGKHVAFIFTSPSPSLCVFHSLSL